MNEYMNRDDPKMAFFIHIFIHHYPIRETGNRAERNSTNLASFWSRFWHEDAESN